MTIEEVSLYAQDFLRVALLISMPALIASLIVGLVVSILQTITSIQDQTLSYVPRILLVGLVIVMTFLGAFAFSAFGLLLGTGIKGGQIGLMFGLIVAPMIFFGCAYYPWKALAAAPVVQVLVLVNPLVYVSEGMRGVLTPALPHMSLPVVAGALVLISAIFMALGLRTFDKRAVS